MRSVFIWCLAICLNIFIFTTEGFSGTVGNPASPNTARGEGVFSLKKIRNIDIKTTFDGEILFRRDLKANAATNAKFSSGQWYMAGASCTFFNRITPYVKLGVAQLKAKWTEDGKSVDLESDANFAWALGGKVLVWEFQKPKIKISGDGFLRMANLHAEKGNYNGAKVDLSAANSRFFVREWQIALLASTELDLTDGGKRDDIAGVGKIAPYIGGKYSGMNGIIRQTLPSGDFHNPGKLKTEKKFGIVAGCDFVGPTDSVWVSLEGRFIDENAMTAGVGVLF